MTWTGASPGSGRGLPCWSGCGHAWWSAWGIAVVDCEPADPGAWWQAADLLVQLAEDVHADYEVDYLDVVDADLAAKDRGDFESVHLRGGRRDALAFCARCQSGEEESVLPFRGIERCLQLLGVRPWSGEGGFQRVKPLEPVMGSEEHIAGRRCEDGALVANPDPAPGIQCPGELVRAEGPYEIHPGI